MLGLVGDKIKVLLDVWAGGSLGVMVYSIFDKRVNMRISVRCG